MKKLIAYGLQMLMGAAVGFLIAYNVLFVTDSPFVLFPSLAAILWTFYAHVIIHEAGHLKGGLFSGYKFVSFRIGPFMFAKGSNGLRFSVSPVKSIAGQCLLMPPPQQKAQPFFLYHAGGALANFIVSTVVFLFMLFTEVSFSGAMFCGVGLLLGITNLLPAASSEVPNDGANIKEARKGEAYLQALQTQLRVGAWLTQGMSLAEMNEEVFALPEGIDPKSRFAVALRLNWYHRLLAQQNLGEAAVIMRGLYEESAGMYPYFQREIQGEWLYCLSAVLYETAHAEELFEKRLKKWLPTYPQEDKCRIYYAYLLLVAKNEDKARKCLERVEKAIKKSVYPSIAKTERQLIEDIAAKAYILKVAP